MNQTGNYEKIFFTGHLHRSSVIITGMYTKADKNGKQDERVSRDKR